MDADRVRELRALLAAADIKGPLAEGSEEEHGPPLDIFDDEGMVASCAMVRGPCAERAVLFAAAVNALSELLDAVVDLDTARFNAAESEALFRQDIERLTRERDEARAERDELRARLASLNAYAGREAHIHEVRRRLREAEMGGEKPLFECASIGCDFIGTRDDCRVSAGWGGPLVLTCPCGDPAHPAPPGVGRCPRCERHGTRCFCPHEGTDDAA